MKRSNTLSNVAAIALAALMTTWFTVRVMGIPQGPAPCLNGCGKNQKPPGCCEPPRCEFNRALPAGCARAKNKRFPELQSKGARRAVPTGLRTG